MKKYLIELSKKLMQKPYIYHTAMFTYFFALGLLAFFQFVWKVTYFLLGNVGYKIVTYFMIGLAYFIEYFAKILYFFVQVLAWIIWELIKACWMLLCLNAIAGVVTPRRD